MEETQVLDVGARLKARRLELGYSLKDAAELTRIRKVYLESLEANQFEALPGKVYVSGFLKAYARYLELDATPLLNHLKSSEDDVPATPIKKAEIHHKEFSAEGWGVFFIGLMAVLLVGAAIFFLPGLFQADPTEDLSLAPVVTKEETLSAQALQPAETALPEVAKPDAVPKAEIASEEPLQMFPAIPQDGASLRMLALAESSLIIHLDDRKPQTYKLHSGLDLTWIVKQKVTIELEDPGVARFWVGKKELPLGGRVKVQLHQSP